MIKKKYFLGTIFLGIFFYSYFKNNSLISFKKIVSQEKKIVFENKIIPIKEEGILIDKLNKREKEFIKKISRYLSQSNFENYLQLKKKCEDQKLSALLNFHKEISLKKDLKLQPSEDFSNIEKSVIDNCQKKIKILFKDNYDSYLEIKEKLNNNLSLEEKINKGLIIDF